MKTIIRDLLAVLILAMPAMLQAQFDYVINADGTSITITGYSTTGFADVIIPTTINGLPVTGIGDGAFGGVYAMTSVTIPASVASIGEGAFATCYSLTNATIPDGVISIGDYAFSSTALTSVTIPASVTSIQGDPFSGCISLTAISVAAQNSIYSSTNGVLFDKNQTTLLEAPGGLAGSYTIPASVTNIDDYAFYYCSVVTNVTIPNSVSNVAVGVFDQCYSLASVTFPAGVASIGDNAFNACYSLTRITIPASVTNIGVNAFSSCMSLSNVTIPGGVGNIGVGAFESCLSLTNATISLGVADIESNAFESCTGLTSITIPGSVTNISEYAFGGCSNLSQVYFTGNAPAADGTSFLDMGYYYIGHYSYPYWYYVSTAYYLPGTTGWAEFSANTGIPAVLWNPVIQAGGASFGVQSNQFGFNITGTTNIPIVVEACTDLAQPVWVPLQSMRLTNGLVYFSEPVETNSAARFYRIGAP